MTEPIRKPVVRRTQQERKDATIGLLLDATIDVIGEVGYARASVQVICARAGVSQGALFGHFETKLDLLMAAGEEVTRRLRVEFLERVANIRRSKDPVLFAVRVLRELSHTSLNAVWIELLVAGRTDPKLQERLNVAILKTFDGIEVASRTLPGMEDMAPAQLVPLLVSIIELFQGSALTAAVPHPPKSDEQQLRMAADVVRAAIAR